LHYYGKPKYKRTLGILADIALEGHIRALRLAHQIIGHIDQNPTRKKPKNK
jgi:hypothetical protein